MSLLNPQNTEPTLAEKKEMVSDNIKNMAATTYQRLLQSQKQGIQIVWSNPNGLTPQEVCDSLGTNATKIFDLHAQLTEAIVNIAAIDGVTPDIALPTKNFSRNQDGTVTVLESDYGT